MKPKQEMRRIVKKKDETFTFDRKAFGRGAYVCNCDECVNMCLKKKLLSKAFKMNISDEIYLKLWEEYAAERED